LNFQLIYKTSLAAAIMATVVVKTCQITLPLDKDDTGNDMYKWMFVPAQKNKILDAIIEVRDKWHNSPVIWVNNCPYRIKVIAENNDTIILWQICLGVYYKRSGKECYHIINKRQVRIVMK
jgi:hypothetical protein